MRNATPTEHWEQVQLFKWASARPELSLMYAVPNGGHRDIRVAAKLKAEGVKPGVPDICLPVARGGFHGLYIELKRRKGGRVSPEQMLWIEALMREGYACAVCLGWQEARRTIEEYMEDASNDEGGIHPAAERFGDAPAGTGADR